MLTALAEHNSDSHSTGLAHTQSDPEPRLSTPEVQQHKLRSSQQGCSPTSCKAARLGTAQRVIILCASCMLHKCICHLHHPAVLTSPSLAACK